MRRGRGGGECVNTLSNRFTYLIQKRKKRRGENAQSDRYACQPFLGRRVLGPVVNLLPERQVVVRPSCRHGVLKRQTRHLVEDEVRDLHKSHDTRTGGSDQVRVRESEKEGTNGHVATGDQRPAQV